MMDRTYDAAVSLLDRQILGDDGQMIGKVDDVTIEQGPDGTWCLTELLLGPGALGPRTGGLVGSWMTAVWQRLCQQPPTGPRRIPISCVGEIGSAIHLTISRSQADVEGFETWVREQIVTRIPGHG